MNFKSWWSQALHNKFHSPVEAYREPTRVSCRFTHRASFFAVLGTALLLPTVSLADDDLYATPVSIRIGPSSATIRGGGTQIYTVFVTYSDGQVLDVTRNNGVGPGTSRTVITESGGAGFMIGPNNSVYQSKSRESDVVTIRAAYSQTADPASPRQVSGNIIGSTSLTVRFP